jgi:hypothetical protein
LERGRKGGGYSGREPLPTLLLGVAQSALHNRPQFRQSVRDLLALSELLSSEHRIMEEANGCICVSLAIALVSSRARRLTRRDRSAFDRETAAALASEAALGIDQAAEALGRPLRVRA